MSESVDVVVVGAGLAGLSAARKLRAAGASVRVLEARQRAGGRLYSAPVGPEVLDLGGQWIGPFQHRVNALVAELGLQTFRTHHEGTKVLSMGGALSTYESDIPSMSPLALVQLELTLRALERMRKEVDPSFPYAGAAAARWDAMTLESWKQRWIKSGEVSRMLDAAVRVVFGVEPCELSMLQFLHYSQSSGGFMRLLEIDGGAQQDRIVGGAQQLATRLADQLGDGVVFGAPVRAIEHRSEEVLVHADGGATRASYCVVAVPPLMAGRIRYDPMLPPLHEQLHQRVPMGATIKVFAVYPRPFWRRRGYSGEAVCDSGPFSVVFDNTGPEGRAACLLGFVVGQDARRFALAPASERRRRALSELSRLFGSEAGTPEHYVEQDWGREEWTRGCPIGTFGAGVLTTCGEALRRPVARILWAGTETAIECTGFMEGAIESGERVAGVIAGSERW